MAYNPKVKLWFKANSVVLVKKNVKFVLPVVLLLLNTAYAQNPGGVTGANLWLKSNGNVYNTGTTQATDGQTVTTWDDAGTSSNDAVQNTAANKPVFVANSGFFNFNPAVSFDGSTGSGRDKLVVNDDLDINGTNTEFKMFFVNIQDAQVEDFFIGSNNPGLTYFRFGIESGNDVFQLSGDDKDLDFSNTLIPFQPSRIATLERSAANSFTTFLNGAQYGAANQSIGGGFSGQFSTNFTQTIIGDGNAGDDSFGGDMAEVIVFPSDLNSTDQQKVESYLALKYGITLNQTSATDYLASDGTDKIWDASAAGGFDEDIFGIGRDTNSALDQRVSKSVNSDGILTLATTADFSSANADGSRTSLTDLEFEVIANDGGAATWTSTGAPTNFNLLTRKWRVQEEGTVATIHLQFDVDDADFNVPALTNGGSYYLIVDTDNDGNFDDETPITLTNSSGSLWSGNVDFDNGERFTLAEFVGKSPAGVTGVSLWLKANDGPNTSTDGANVSSWADQSGNGNNATTAAGNIQFESDEATAFNYNPILQFDRTELSGAMADRMAGVSAPISNNDKSHSFYIVQRVSTTSSFREIFTFGELDDGGYCFQSSGSSAAFFTPGNISVGSGSSKNEINIVEGIANGTTLQTYLNGGASNSSSSNPTTISGAYQIGSGLSGSQESTPSDLRIAEIIAYDQTNGTTERQRIESYLALKYGITLDQTSATDYLASDGTDKIWDASAAGGVDEDIFGIGRDTNSALDQRVSKSVNSDGILTLATTADFSSANADGSRTSLTELEFEVIANDGGAAAWTSTGAPTNFNLLTRKWRVQEEGTVGTVHLQFDVDDTDFNVPVLTKGGNYFLIVDANNNNDFSDDDPVALNNTSGSLWRGSVDFDNGERFTLAEFTGAIPGGVAGTHLWLKANLGASSTQWNDQSGNGIDATATGSPTVLSNAMNFNPTVEFDGNNGNLSYYSTANVDLGDRQSIFFVVNDSNRANPFGGVAYHGQVNLPRDNDFAVSLTTSISLFGSGTNYSTANQPALGGVISVRNGVGAVYENGRLRSTPTGGTEEPGSVPYYIGIWNSLLEVFEIEGEIAEVIVYDADINTGSQVQQIHSYLALKYGIALSQVGATADGGVVGVGDYLASDGSIIWNAPLNDVGEFNDDIFGIGRDDESDLDQRVSKSVNDDGILTLATTADFSSTNSDGGRSSLTNMGFEIIANNGLGANWTTTGSPTDFQILNRKWQVQESGTVGTVHLQFNVDDAEIDVPALSQGEIYYLLVDANNNNDFTDDTPLALTNTSISLWSGSVDFDNGERFTLAEYVGPSPGGVGANLSLWLKANEDLLTTGVNITSWEEQTSINSFTTTGSPDKKENGLNYNPTVLFDGSSYFTGNNTITTEEVFAVAKIENPGNGSGSGAVLGSVDIHHRYFFHTETERIYIWGGNNTLASWHLSTLYGSSGTSSVPFSLLSANLDQSPNQDLYLNGLAYSDNVDPTALNRTPTIGSRRTEPFQSGSEIAEVIAYSSGNGSTDRLKIQSYLALKYGITLSNTNGGTHGDYVLSSGSTIWDASNESAYQNDVVGLVRDDDSDLLQKQSTTSNDSLQIYLSNLAANNDANVGSFGSDLSSVVIGHNGAAYKASYSGPNVPTVTEKPGSIYARFDREWKITNTNFNGTFSLKFNWDEVGAFNISDIRLLVDADGDFTNATVLASGQSGITISSGSIVVSGISTSVIPANSTRFITIGTVSSSTPLPVTLTQFEAEKQGENDGLLTWTTSSEINNSHFLLERKSRNSEFESIAEVRGNGTTNSPNHYQWVDPNLNTGTYYYRLKQVDYDGNYEYFPMKQLEIDNESSSTKESFAIYPNPAHTVLNILSTKTGEYNLSVIDNLGKEVFRWNNTLEEGTPLSIDISQLENGMYFILFNQQRLKFVVQH